ncbi:hypothetical protein CL632_02700, partial [bacterium]|nr:hypothetical protein [bacterium]
MSKERQSGVGQGFEQLARIDTSKLKTETPRSRLLDDIQALKAEFQKDPKKYAMQIAELEELASAYLGSPDNNDASAAAALEDTKEQLEGIRLRSVEPEVAKQRDIPHMRGGNGSEKEKKESISPEQIGDSITRALDNIGRTVRAIHQIYPTLSAHAKEELHGYVSTAQMRNLGEYNTQLRAYRDRTDLDDTHLQQVIQREIAEA